MDILYQLPLPKEVCSKIFIYACKSPYTDLSAIVLKHVLGFNIYESLVAKGGIVSDDIRNPINFKSINTIWCLSRNSRKLVTFDIFHFSSLKNLTLIKMFGTGVYGDIAHLKSLNNLTEVCIDGVGIYGDISHFNTLLRLKSLDLSNTSVTGDIINLKSLLKLTHIKIYNTKVYGDINYMKNLPNIIRISICDLLGNNITGISGDDQEFHKYRESKKLRKCVLNI